MTRHAFDHNERLGSINQWFSLVLDRLMETKHKTGTVYSANIEPLNFKRCAQNCHGEYYDTVDIVCKDGAGMNGQYGRDGGGAKQLAVDCLLWP